MTGLDNGCMSKTPEDYYNGSMQRDDQLGFARKPPRFLAPCVCNIQQLHWGEKHIDHVYQWSRTSRDAVLC